MPSWRSTRTRRFLGLRVSTVANLGAYLSHYGPFIPTLAGSNMLTGVYAIPAAFVEVKGVYTNTAPVDAYRGAGRPEAAYVIERLVDAAAREMGLAPDEIRRRNFIIALRRCRSRRRSAATFDCGDFARNLGDTMRNGDVGGLRRAPRRVRQGRQAARPRHGVLHRDLRRRLGRDGADPLRARAAASPC